MVSMNSRNFIINPSRLGLSVGAKTLQALITEGTTEWGSEKYTGDRKAVGGEAYIE